MEGIFVLKIIGDTNFEKITNNPQTEIKNLISEFSNKGYPFANAQILEALKISDTIFLTYQFKKQFIYIIKDIKLSNYYSKTIIYKEFLKKFKRTIINLSKIEKQVKILDEFYNLKSSIKIYENYLLFENEKFPLNASGGLTFSDSFLNGNISLSFDFFNFSYKKNYLNLSFEFPLPIEFLNKLALRYYKNLGDNNFESYININGFFSGFRVLNSKVGIIGGYESKKLNLRVEGMDFFYKFFLKMNIKFLSLELLFNQIDSVAMGGSENILGYMENSIICRNYFLLTFEPKFLIFYPIAQIYWIDKSKTLYSYGLGIGNETIKIIFAINGRERNPYLHLIIRS